jgi:hypothetical protein
MMRVMIHETLPLAMSAWCSSVITPFPRIPKASFGDVLVWCPPDQHIAKHGLFHSEFLHFPISGEAVICLVFGRTGNVLGF